MDFFLILYPKENALDITDVGTSQGVMLIQRASEGEQPGGNTHTGSSHGVILIGRAKTDPVLILVYTDPNRLGLYCVQCTLGWSEKTPRNRIFDQTS